MEQVPDWATVASPVRVGPRPNHQQPLSFPGASPVCGSSRAETPLQVPARVRSVRADLREYFLAFLSAVF